MNNNERELWVNNDEYLYNKFIRSKQSMSKFIKEWRDVIDETIDLAINPNRAKQFFQIKEPKK